MMDRIVIIDDCSETVKILVSLLSQYLSGVEIATADCKASAMNVVSHHSSDIIILDAILPDCSGLELCETFKKRNPCHNIILLTAYPSNELFDAALELGASCCINKLDGFNKLIDTILKMVVSKRPATGPLFEQLELPNGVVKKLFFYSPAMQYMRQHLGRVAPTNKTIVIEGESGSGKELVARMVHQQSERRSHLFIPIDCGAIPDSLFESELFGYEKGAFSGAEFQRDGMIQMAHEGTLLLDEVTNLSLQLQPKLLRVIQERSYKRLGGMKIIAVDVRIVATTNVALDDAVSNKTFRSDLFYRLNEYCIKVPPLRERTEDLMPLAHCLLEEACKPLGKDIVGFSGEAQDILMRYNWPGNVRELKNEIGNAALACRGDCILPSDLSIHLSKPLDRKACEQESAMMTYKRQLAELEKTTLSAALEMCHGNRKEAAKQIGMTYRTYLRKLKKHGL